MFLGDNINTMPVGDERFDLGLELYVEQIRAERYSEGRIWRNLGEWGRK